MSFGWFSLLSTEGRDSSMSMAESRKEAVWELRGAASCWFEGISPAMGVAVVAWARVKPLFFSSAYASRIFFCGSTGGSLLFHRPVHTPGLKAFAIALPKRYIVDGLSWSMPAS